MNKVILLCVAGLTGCATVGPDHQVPTTETPEQYKNANSKTALLKRGQWWKVFKDAELTRLLEKLDKSKDLDKASPNQAALVARRDQAHAELRAVKASRSPSIRATGDLRPQQESENTDFRTSEGTFERYELALNLEYEIDLWGRIRRQVEAASARSGAADATYRHAMLSLRAELARTYFSLRSLDDEIDLLKRAVRLREDGADLVRARADAGQISDDDVARSTAELEATRGDLTALQRDRARFENAIAALIGASPSDFELAPVTRNGAVPEIPSGVPSELLARRADVTEKERLLAAACADLGVAIADFLPRITLTGRGGLSSLRASDLFDPASKMWDIGPKIDVPVFRNGLSRERKAKAQAALDEARANYRQAVLDAFRDTENAIHANQSLQQESRQRNRATRASAQASKLAQLRYESGLTSYLEVLDSLRTHLANERLETQTRGDHFQATVALIQALGGGWKR